MKPTVKALWGIGIASTFLIAAPAYAVPVTDTWTDPAGDILLDLSNSDQPIAGVKSFYEYQHNITNDGFTIGDTITSAKLYVSVSDSGGSETYQYEIGLGPTQTTIFSNVPNDRVDAILLGAFSLADLQLDGIIDVVIRITDDSNNQEGLYFVSSSLVAQVNGNGTQPTQLPEPGTLAVVALGLAGLGWRSRRILER